jgi:hypothetical protein
MSIMVLATLEACASSSDIGLGVKFLVTEGWQRVVLRVVPFQGVGAGGGQTELRTRSGEQAGSCCQHFPAFT